jgi:hypothetical protein
VQAADVKAERAAQHCRPAGAQMVPGRCSRRPARPIHGKGRMARIQSAKDGMKPRSCCTCCSPTQRVGMMRPDERVSVGPKIVSSVIWTASAIKRGQA